mmetsp:Transcript_30651/g.78270  ORF Transcript_30651/g.78270 Transcript_30651/m.78270 type:complete len:310 (+) Transcript_30651:180-1109(+)
MHARRTQRPFQKNKKHTPGSCTRKRAAAVPTGAPRKHNSFLQTKHSLSSAPAHPHHTHPVPDKTQTHAVFFSVWFLVSCCFFGGVFSAMGWRSVRAHARGDRCSARAARRSARAPPPDQKKGKERRVHDDLARVQGSSRAGEVQAPEAVQHAVKQGAVIVQLAILQRVEPDGGEQRVVHRTLIGMHFVPQRGQRAARLLRHHRQVLIVIRHEDEGGDGGHVVQPAHPRTRQQRVHAAGRQGEGRERQGGRAGRGLGRGRGGGRGRGCWDGSHGGQRGKGAARGLRGGGSGAGGGAGAACGHLGGHSRPA